MLHQFMIPVYLKDGSLQRLPVLAENSCEAMYQRNDAIAEAGLDGLWSKIGWPKQVAAVA